jgi:hypothetical protein
MRNALSGAGRGAVAPAAFDRQIRLCRAIPVVAGNVIKPAAANIVTLAAMAIILVGSAEIFLRRQ